ncbi:MAG: hypothetical protein JWO74_5094 [Solirubrobacterales bacterium]|jgi:hypothetical protein|nr:hypothetical protein [Solirubrobacterales bacterium]
MAEMMAELYTRRRTPQTTTAVMVVRRPLATAERVGIVLLGVIASAVAFLVGILAWLHAAEVACHGGYECPF